MARGATFAQHKTYITGETITASDRNADSSTILNNLDGSGIGSYYTNVTEMQATSDPYPASVPAVPGDLLVWMKQMQYMIAQITAKTYWYEDPDENLSTAVFASGTEMVFYQAAAPTGWTQNATNTDAGLRVVSGTGGGTGGSLSFASATVANHTLTTGEMPSHTHTQRVYIASGGAGPGLNTATTGDDNNANGGSTASAGSGGAHDHGLALKYIDVIVAAKD